MDLEVHATKRIDGTVKAPPSKSYTHRAFLMAFLADKVSSIRDPLYSEDTLSSLNSCKAFGSEVNRINSCCKIHGTAGKPLTPENILDLKNSGTTLRIMTSVASLAPDYTVLTGDSSLRTRPMQDLLDALRGLSVTAFSTRNNGKPPICIKGGFKGGQTDIKGNISSQFISSLLIASPYAKNPVDINIKGNFISKPYVDMTTDVMEKFGVNSDYDEENNSFHIENQSYKGRDYTIEGDFSSASYIIGAAAALEGEVVVKNLFKDS